MAQQYFDNYRKALDFNDYMVRTTMEYWTAFSYPALYFAKYL